MLNLVIYVLCSVLLAFGGHDVDTVNLHYGEDNARVIHVNNVESVWQSNDYALPYVYTVLRMSDGGIVWCEQWVSEAYTIGLELPYCEEVTPAESWLVEW